MYLEMRRNTEGRSKERNYRPGMPSSRVAITTLRVKMEWQGDAGADTDRYAFAASR